MSVFGQVRVRLSFYTPGLLIVALFWGTSDLDSICYQLDFKTGVSLSLGVLEHNKPLFLFLGTQSLKN